LTLSAQPWAEVSLDGRRLGTTPLRRQRVRPGPHQLTFSCPPLGRTERFSIHVPRAADAKVVVDLSVTPARRTLDGASELR
jgi:hypothetical protein